MADAGNDWEQDGVNGNEGAYDQYSGDQNDSNDYASRAPDDVPEDESDDGADYDPESVGLDVVPAPAPAAAREPAAAAPAKARMSGGFLVEDEDDDDDDDDNQTPQSNTIVQTTPQIRQPDEKRLPSVTPAEVPSSNTPTAMPGINPIALLEARVKEDPRGDMDAWLALMAENRRQSNMAELRTTYTRFLEVFPQAGDIWAEWVETELAMDNFGDAERLFGQCLMTVPNIRLWTIYLNYIRRRNDLSSDATGQARQTVTQSYEFVLDHIGVDRDAGDIWQDYIQFIKSGPGQVGGTGWQDQQKMDQMRKAYHRAICIPMSSINNLWKEYDQFEMSLNKVTGRKFIQERSPGYMSAKSGNIALDNIGRNLKRTTLPRLPPAPGFDGDEEYREQVEIWKKWIAWEKEDPLVLKEDEPKVFTQRILYCYKQALMALRFWPEMWIDAAEWCYQNDIRENEKEMGTEFLTQGITANPESVLLALKRADRLESTYSEREGDKAEFAKAVREPFDKILETLYAMGDKVKEREKLEISTLQQAAAANPVHESIEPNDNDSGQPRKTATEMRIQAIQQANAVETQLLSKTISFIWIALARAMRRIQGKGSQSDGGLRKVFTDARQKGRLTSDVYVAVALLESIVYKDPVGAKIFERGARLFPNDEVFMIEYLKFLHSKDDTTNARVVFETCVNRLVAKPETLAKAKPLYAYFHKYESQFGELSQISKLEDRMAELFPDDPRLSIFMSRYSNSKFDPIVTPIIISKAVQMRPKVAVPVISGAESVQNSPRPRRQDQSPMPNFVRATASPKRPFGVDDDELNPPKRVARGISPLKGAAGRRLDQQRRNQSASFHRDITFLLGILPPAHTYDAQRFSAPGMVSLLRDVHLPDYSSWRARTGGQYMQIGGHARQASGDYARGSSPYPQSGPPGNYRNQPVRLESAANVYGSGAYGQQQGGANQQGQYGGYRY